MKRTIVKLFKQKRRDYHTNKAKKTVKSFKEPLHVNFDSSFTSHTSMGKNTHYNGMSIQGKGNVNIGDNFHSGKECMMITEIHNYEGAALPYDNTYITKNINIEDNVWLGNKVLILGGVTIGEGAIIQAGAVVVSDIPKFAIAGGNPAKVFKYRNVEHYERLKTNEKFV
ncbi:acyltransferase [Marinococcus halophilus]|uniref:acyltransferase n=1 Tax=Marinococcus halophilus TaxID=1371 RepID=UPI0009A7730A|nr:acyltransferase [Marinococcus halophilus]